MSRCNTGHRLLMNPGPTNVHTEVRAAMSVGDMSHRAPAFRNAVAEVLAQLSEGLNGAGDYETVMFVSSGTGANEAMIGAIQGLVLLIDKGRYSQRLGDIARRRGLDLVSWSSDLYETFDRIEFERMLDLHPRVASVLMVHLETTTGVLLPLEAIAAVCRDRGIALYVDAISSIGGHAFDLQKMPVTMCTVTPNKCLEGLPGISFVVAQTEALDRNPPGASPSFYFDLHEQRAACRANRLPYTASIPIVLAARAALRRWRDEGVDARIDRYARNARYLRKRLIAQGVDVVMDEAETTSNIITTLRPGTRFDYGKLVEFMEARGIEIYSPSALQIEGRAILGTMGDISEADLDDFIEAFEAFLKGPA